MLGPVSQIARRAGREILAIYHTEFDVAEKTDTSPLTAADLAAHKVIKAGLEALTPELPILSEEATRATPFEERARWTTYWLVDPLDGTREFVKRNGEFTVNIALIHEHRPVLGVVHVPVKALDYFGSMNGGAFRRNGEGKPEPIHVATLGDGPVRVVGSRSHGGDSLAKFLERIGEHELVPMGSSLKFCLVAEGKADVYPRLGPTSEWDTAAAQAVVEAAGGHVVDSNGKPMLYNTKADILNPHFLVYGDDSRDWTRYL
ncbi:MAG TPA: 3'(2'),5'-bisphosphate nucleotidase CysQ [Gammaproteobacteria bacterium]|nr:3'(2'),5'-bisphosphate nucleotidase CysQ [Gammaproteobacteria bacterium]